MADEGCEGGDDSSSQWLIGATMNISGSIMINLGTNLMKFGHMETARAEKAAAAAAAADARNSTPEGNQPTKAGGNWWHIGMGLFVLGNLLNFASFSFANQSLLAALGSVQFVTNVAFGRFVLKMVISANIIIGTAIIVLANVIIVAFTQGDGDECGPTLSSKDLASLYAETNYIIYLSCCAVAGLASYAGYRVLKARPRPPMNLLGVCYVISSAVIGTQSVTLCKSLSTLIRDSLQGNNQFVYPFTYVVIVATICTAVFWVKRMSAALKKFDALFIIPVLQVFWTSLSIVGGGVYYKEFDRYTLVHLCTHTLFTVHSYTMHSYTVHSYTMHSYTMHSYTMHSYTMHSYTMHSYTMHSYTIHSYTMHSYTIHSYTMHSYTMHSYTMHSYTIHNALYSYTILIHYRHR
jgi:drug/metabolite transporter (DMT)-like permease